LINVKIGASFECSNDQRRSLVVKKYKRIEARSLTVQFSLGWQDADFPVRNSKTPKPNRSNRTIVRLTGFS